MVEFSVLKIYNKNNKLKFIFIDTGVTKTASIYKYNGENVDVHSFTYSKKGKLKPWSAYYEMRAELKGILKESLLISESQIEHNEWFGELEMARTTTNLNSKNKYENRVKYFVGEKYEVEFKNDKLYDFRFSLKGDKINEYLKTLHDGKEKN